MSVLNTAYHFINERVGPFLESLIVGALLEAGLAAGDVLQSAPFDWKTLWWAAATAALNYITSRLRKMKADYLENKLAIKRNEQF